jgi:hypothetical protein
MILEPRRAYLMALARPCPKCGAFAGMPCGTPSARAFNHARQNIPSALETARLVQIERCKRLMKTGLTITRVGELSGIGTGDTSRTRRYVNWPECVECGAILREASESGRCGICELP